MKAWASRSISEFIAHYSKDFENNGMSRDDYQKYKNNVFNSYKVMDVSIDKLRVITHPKYAVSLMDQDFRGDQRFSAGGRKVLYWKKSESGQWQIVREVHQNKRLEFVKFSSQDSPHGKQASVLSDKKTVSESVKPL